MKQLIKEIEKLGGMLVFQWTGENGMSNDVAQDAVLVIMKEYLNPQKPNVEDMRELIVTLKELIK